MPTTSDLVTKLDFSSLSAILTVFHGNRGAQIELFDHFTSSVTYTGHFFQKCNAKTQFDAFTREHHVIDWAFFRD